MMQFRLRNFTLMGEKEIVIITKCMVAYAKNEDINMDRSRLPLKNGMLSRKRIHRLLDEGLGYPLVSINGGPGYGKTQAVAQFVQSIKQRVIWLNLTQLDNNSEHFWHTLVSSIGHELPDFAADLRGHDFPGTIREFDRHLIEAAGALEFVEDTVFVIDNFSVIDDGPVSTFLETLMRAQLARLCVFLISTDMSDQNFAESLVGRDFLEISPEMLRFTREEADLLFKYSGVEITRPGMDKVMQDTAGWPLAVYLVCKQYTKLKTTQQGLPETRLPELDRLFDNGFYETYPVQIRRLLVGCSFLPSFTPDMAKGILGDDLGIFTSYIFHNVFVSYDFTSKTFLFHPMYQDYLKRKRYAITEDEMSELYGAAGGWFCENARYLEAVSCYYSSARFDDMVDAILKMPIGRKDANTTVYLLSFLEKLPESYITSRPLAQYLIAALHLNRMEARKAKALFLELELLLGTLPDNNDNRQLLGEVYAALADIGLMLNESTCFEYYPKAAALLTEGSRFHSKTILHVGNNNALFLPGNSPGVLQDTVEKMIASVTYSEGYLNGQSLGAAHLFAAEAAYSVCDMALAVEHCHRAIYRAQREDQHDIVCNGYYLQMRCALFEGDNETVEHMQKTLSDYCEKREVDTLGELYDNAMGWLYLRLGMPEMVPRWISEYDNQRFSQHPVSMGRNKIVFAHYLLASYKYRECVAFLDGMEWVYREKGLWTIRLHHYIMKALCLANIGRTDEALAWLHKAYLMTYANNMLMPFVEYGNMMRALLTSAANQSEHSFESAWIAKTREMATRYAESIVLIKKRQQKHLEARQPGAKLSKREHEVLDLLVKGATRGEIARLLGISINSVKTHMAGVYSKLGAVNKADATRIAIRMGIINLTE